MKVLHAKAIRSARHAARLTQDELGQRIGRNGRAIGRWELAEFSPTRRNRAALVTAITLVDAEAGQALRAAFEARADAAAAARASISPPAPPSLDVAVQLALLTFAHELDLPPRRARSALVKLCKQLEGAGMTMDALRACLERVLPEGDASA
jgi:transcriptional regulator with XRE-family HTH domain